jgi:protein-tyrosine-phosphatase
MADGPPTPTKILPGAVLFACTMNRVRSPMAAALMQRRFGDRVYVDSCGIREGEGIDPFVVAVMAEIGADLSEQTAKTFDQLNDGSFDLIVAMSPEAAARAEARARGVAVEIEVWPTEDPTLDGGARAQRLDAYRRVRDQIRRKIDERFA